jgi:S-formylglutathione hydrolase FrmB
MSAPGYSEAELDAAIAALENPDRFREAEAMVGVAAPKLARVLAQALEAGGWFAASHDDAAATAATTPDEAERLTAVRTLLAEEARVGMLVGVAVGWALHEELSKDKEET